MSLNLTLDPAETEPLFLQIAARIRSAIANGHLEAGARLPSARVLAAQLAVARGTVDAAFALLAGEGAILSRGAAGTVVSGTPGSRIAPVEHTPFMFADETEPARPGMRPGTRPDTRPGRVPGALPHTLPGTLPGTAPDPLPFQMGLPALDAFPRKLWSNLTVQAARAMQPADLAATDPAGHPELRHAIAAYLGVARGIRCSPSQVLITAGYQGALALVRSVLLRHGDPVWIEDPGYHMTRQALEAAGARVVPVRTDQDGLRVASGIATAPGARLAVVTPTHQCPTGVALALPRRMELLAWAANAAAWILEDDYDSEYRYVGRPLPALKSLDRGQRVLYAGTFSKVLFPALRLGYLVVPPELVTPFLRASRLLTAGQPMLQQLVVAGFMQKGHFARHIRRMRTLYAERRRALAAAMQAGFGGAVTIELAAGGMHLLARFPDGPDDTVLARRAAASGLTLSALSTHSMAHGHGQGLLLSFTNIPPAAASAAVQRLRDALGRPG
jgi:GntR family transcriptional regulator/MocR family aminotransferase